MSTGEKVLVIVLAETRAHEHTFQCFRENVLDVFSADLCLCVAESEFEDTNNPFYQHAKYIWTCPEHEDWGNAFDKAQREQGTEAPWRKLLAVGDQWLGGVKGVGQQPGSAAILLFFRWFLRQCLLETDVLHEYDRFIITRSDFMHCIPHVPLRLLEENSIWVPYGEDYGGYTDRHIVVHRRDVLNVLSITDFMLSEPEQIAQEMSHFNHWNLERFIKFSFTRQGLAERIKRYPYSMYAVRKCGGRTRWSTGKFDRHLGYYVKYRSEYKRFLRVQRYIRKESDWNMKTMHVLNGQEDADLRYMQRRNSWNRLRKDLVLSARQANRKLFSYLKKSA
ncbi:MAG: hypothetical protein CMJ70_28330 [Planctomycetaceae bacterium]|nr:hypothetical protein [Planctomycetaceae bacterium]